jgi:hypothetical protein
MYDVFTHVYVFQIIQVDIKNKKMFLKKTPLTVENTKEDFCVGKKVYVSTYEFVYIVKAVNNM